MKSIIVYLVLALEALHTGHAFLPLSSTTTTRTSTTVLNAGVGFGAGASNKSEKKHKSPRLADALADRPRQSSKKFLKSQRDRVLQAIASESSGTVIGKAVASAPTESQQDPFWMVMPSTISSRFPDATDSQLERVAGFIRHTLDRNLPLEDEIIINPYRREQDIEAYMPGLGETKPFHDPSQVELCKQLSENYEIIREEYKALLKHKKCRFRSVGTMDYGKGWDSLVLFVNGNRIKDFPYDLCPVTTKILESFPLAGKIAGFNRQKPQTGIPLHSEGNNMWLTCQMGIRVPKGNKAYIRVGPEKRRWKRGKCLLFDTTYEHETFNEHESHKLVVLNVDFFNTIAMTPIEIEVMQFIYDEVSRYIQAIQLSKKYGEEGGAGELLSP